MCQRALYREAPNQKIKIGIGRDINTSSTHVLRKAGAISLDSGYAELCLWKQEEQEICYVWNRCCGRRLTPLAENLPFPVIYLRGRLSLWYRESYLFRKASLLNVSTDNRHAWRLSDWGRGWNRCENDCWRRVLIGGWVIGKSIDRSKRSGNHY